MRNSSEFASRRRELGTALPGKKLDALIVSFPPNVRYLTGFTGSNGLLLLLPDDALFFTDPRYRTQSREQVDCRVTVCKTPLLGRAWSAVKRRKAMRVGVEAARISYEAVESLKKDLPLGVEIVPVTGLIEKRRMVKSASEVARIRQSVLTNSQAFEDSIAHLKPGMQESELAAEIDYCMRRLGADAPAFATIVAAGARSALPHAHPGGARIEQGQLLLIDMGAFRDGYASDMTRMLHIGDPTPDVRHTHAILLRAQLAAIAAVRAGVKAVDVDRAARDVLKTEGLDRAFVHSTGHGLGLEIHEPPRLGRRDKTKLAAGMVVTIEPGVYLEGVGGFRIEDTVVVTETGCEILTPTDKELRVI